MGIVIQAWGFPQSPFPFHAFLSDGEEWLARGGAHGVQHHRGAGEGKLRSRLPPAVLWAGMLAWRGRHLGMSAVRTGPSFDAICSAFSTSHLLAVCCGTVRRSVVLRHSVP